MIELEEKLCGFSESLFAITRKAKTASEIETCETVETLRRAIYKYVTTPEDRRNAYPIRNACWDLKGEFIMEAMGVCVVMIILSYFTAAVGHVMVFLIKYHHITSFANHTVALCLGIVDGLGLIFFFWKLWRVIVFHRRTGKIARKILKITSPTE